MTQPSINQNLALEMAMQDVMENMQELALDFGFNGDGAGFEILAIEPADSADTLWSEDRTARIRSPYNAEVCPHPRSDSRRVA